MDDIYTQMFERLKSVVISGEQPHRIRRFWIATDNVLVIEASKTLPFFKLLSLHDQVKQ